MFQAPAVVAKVSREPIEQFRICGMLALRSEVFGCANKPTAEELVPDAIDHDASSQRIFRGYKPPGEIEPGARRRVAVQKDGWNTGIDLGSFRAIVAADCNVCFGRARVFGYRHRIG